MPRSDLSKLGSQDTTELARLPSVVIQSILYLARAHLLQFGVIRIWEECVWSDSVQLGK